MKIKIEIETGNDAFVDNLDYEVSTILRNLADDVSNLGCGEVPVKIYDYNGNVCGTFTVED